MQDNKPTYTKLSNLVNDTFTVTEAFGYQWKRYNAEVKRMEISEQYAEGFRKMYTINTDKGRMDLGAGQLGQLLEGVYQKGVADINGRTFSVKSNGKTGMDIRYYINPVRDNAPKQDTLPKHEDVEKQIDLADIPF